jgi:hypothetical protein
MGLIVSILLTAFLSTSVGSAEAREPRGVRSNARPASSSDQTSTIVVDELPLPRSLREMVSRSAAVIRGRVVSVGRPERLPNGQMPTAVRFHLIEVLEVIKDDPSRRIPKRIRVMQFGGTLIEDKQEVQTANPGSILRADDEVVLFLKGYHEDYSLVSNSAGVFQVDKVQHDTVRIPKAAEHMADLPAGSLTVGQLETKIRAIGGVK